MKKFFLILGLLACGTLGACAQDGYVSFYDLAIGVMTNTSVSVYNQGNEMGGVSGKTATSNSGLYYIYALLYDQNIPTAIDSNSAAGPDWNLVTGAGGGDLLITNNPFQGGIDGPGGANGVQVNLSSGSSYNVILVGWSANLGTSWLGAGGVESQLASGNWSGDGFYGETVVGTLIPDSPPAPGVSLFPTYPEGSLILYAVPEPATLALAGLGGLSMLFLRRRKS